VNGENMFIVEETEMQRNMEYELFTTFALFLAVFANWRRTKREREREKSVRWVMQNGRDLLMQMEVEGLLACCLLALMIMYELMVVSLI
jgi:hypothetical protein